MEEQDVEDIAEKKLASNWSPMKVGLHDWTCETMIPVNLI